MRLACPCVCELCNASPGVDERTPATGHAAGGTRGNEGWASTLRSSTSDAVYFGPDSANSDVATVDGSGSGPRAQQALTSRPPGGVIPTGATGPRPAEGAGVSAGGSASPSTKTGLQSVAIGAVALCVLAVLGVVLRRWQIGQAEHARYRWPATESPVKDFETFFFQHAEVDEMQWDGDCTYGDARGVRGGGTGNDPTYGNIGDLREGTIGAQMVAMERHASGDADVEERPDSARARFVSFAATGIEAAAASGRVAALTVSPRASNGSKDGATYDNMAASLQAYGPTTLEEIKPPRADETVVAGGWRPALRPVDESGVVDLGKEPPKKELRFSAPVNRVSSGQTRSPSVILKHSTSFTNTDAENNAKFGAFSALKRPTQWRSLGQHEDIAAVADAADRISLLGARQASEIPAARVSRLMQSQASTGEGSHSGPASLLRFRNETGDSCTDDDVEHIVFNAASQAADQQAKLTRLKSKLTCPELSDVSSHSSMMDAGPLSNLVAGLKTMPVRQMRLQQRLEYGGAAP